MKITPKGRLTVLAWRLVRIVRVVRRAVGLTWRLDIQRMERLDPEPWRRYR